MGKKRLPERPKEQKRKESKTRVKLGDLKFAGPGKKKGVPGRQREEKRKRTRQQAELGTPKKLRKHDRATLLNHGRYFP